MICRNCGKKIKDLNRGKCEHCGYPIQGNYEGNGFFDILTKKEEPPAYTASAAPANGANNEVIGRLVNAQRETKKRLNTERIFRFVLIAVCLVLAIMLFVKTSSLNDEIDVLKTKISEFHKDSAGDETVNESDDDKDNEPNTVTQDDDDKDKKSEEISKDNEEDDKSKTVTSDDDDKDKKPEEKLKDDEEDDKSKTVTKDDDKDNRSEKSSTDDGKE